jgi:hypothetical protein
MFVALTHGDRVIRADYNGGPYIELTFGRLDFKPTEVINVWDYDAGVSTVAEDDSAAVLTEVLAWIASHEAPGDDQWPTWYEDYIENARY